jgi:hypothetical protein
MYRPRFKAHHIEQIFQKSIQPISFPVNGPAELKTIRRLQLTELRMALRMRSVSIRT